MQLDLDFLEKIQSSGPKTWENLDDEQRQAIIEKLSRLIIQAVQICNQEENHDDE